MWSTESTPKDGQLWPNDRGNEAPTSRGLRHRYFNWLRKPLEFQRFPWNRPRLRDLSSRLFESVRSEPPNKPMARQQSQLHYPPPTAGVVAPSMARHSSQQLQPLPGDTRSIEKNLQTLKEMQENTIKYSTLLENPITSLGKNSRNWSRAQQQCLHWILFSKPKSCQQPIQCHDKTGLQFLGQSRSGHLIIKHSNWSINSTLAPEHKDCLGNLVCLAWQFEETLQHMWAQQHRSRRI